MEERLTVVANMRGFSVNDILTSDSPVVVRPIVTNQVPWVPAYGPACSLLARLAYDRANYLRAAPPSPIPPRGGLTAAAVTVAAAQPPPVGGTAAAAFPHLAAAVATAAPGPSLAPARVAPVVSAALAAWPVKRLDKQACTKRVYVFPVPAAVENRGLAAVARPRILRRPNILRRPSGGVGREVPVKVKAKTWEVDPRKKKTDKEPPRGWAESLRNISVQLSSVGTECSLEKK